LVLSGGSTDLGTDLREVLVISASNRVREFGWEEIQTVEFFPGPAGSGVQRLHGTVDLEEGPSHTGFLGWDLNGVLLSDTLTGFDSQGDRHEFLFREIREIRREGDGADVLLSSGARIRLSDHEDVSDRNDGIHVSDPLLGLVAVDWEEMERARFHPPDRPAGHDSFFPDQRIRGTVLTADSTEFEGWIRWDGDEEYSWELLDGRDRGVGYDVEFSNILQVERARQRTVSLTIGTQGADVGNEREEWTEVTLRSGRVLELDGSNDVDSSNHGIYVLPYDASWSPDDEEAVWIMIQWDDFQSARFEWEVGG
jgi:hypothetical protein